MGMVSNAGSPALKQISLPLLLRPTSCLCYHDNSMQPFPTWKRSEIVMLGHLRARCR